MGSPQISGRMVTAKIRYEEGSYTGEVNDSKIPNGEGTFEYRGDDEDGRLMYDGAGKERGSMWLNKQEESTRESTRTTSSTGKGNIHGVTETGMKETGVKDRDTATAATHGRRKTRSTLALGRWGRSTETESLPITVEMCSLVHMLMVIDMVMGNWLRQMERFERKSTTKEN